MAQSQEGRSMRERMIAGELYGTGDEELSRLYTRAQRLLLELNATSFEQPERRRELLVDLFGAYGEGCEVKSPFLCDFGAHIFMGERVFLNYDCVILDCSYVRIGDRTRLAPRVQVYSCTHPVDPSVRADGLDLARPVTIGADVWIGGGSVICPGVTIGDGTTIGAGSVVTRDIPPYVVAAGNPCRVIRELEAGGTH